MENDEKEMTKSKTNWIVTIIACIITGVVVFLVMYFVVGTGKTTESKTNSNSSSATNSASNSNSVSNESTNNNNVQELSVKTYRFFGYTGEDNADMYTTLKLYSDGTYEFYINNCHGVNKEIGKYTETNNKISLTGDKNMEFNKIENGNTLEFNFEELGACNNSGGRFSLESSVLGSTQTSTASTKTYRFFGHMAGADIDMYTTLKLHSNGKYELYINNCHGISKLNGDYTETNNKILLTGGKNMEFNKTNSGNTLEFNFNDLSACNDTGGSFSLENYMLEN